MTSTKKIPIPCPEQTSSNLVDIEPMDEASLSVLVALERVTDYKFAPSLSAKLQPLDNTMLLRYHIIKFIPTVSTPMHR